MAEKPAPAKGKTRAAIRAVLNDDKYQKRIEQLVDSAFDLQRLVDVFCPDCRRKLKAEAPDVQGTVRVLVELLEQGEGKPGSDDAGVSIVVERPPL